MRKLIALSIACLCVFALSNTEGATSRLKVRSSPLGNHVHSHEHHVGKTRAASCAGVSRARGAVRFGAVRAGVCACGVGCPGGCPCGCP